MNETTSLKINTTLMNKSILNLSEYLILAYLRECPETSPKEIQSHIITNLETFGYIRVIEDIILINAKAADLFDKDDNTDAKEILEHYNKLKKEHLGINRATVAPKYITKFKSLLIQRFEKEHIMAVLTYLFKTWKKDAFWKPFLNKIDTITRNFDGYSNDYEMNRSIPESRNEML